MTVTDERDPESDTDAERRFKSIEDMVIFHHPELAYLINLTLPVRPPTEAESAAYAARYEDGDWQEIYSPAGPRIVLPPNAPEITALLDPPPAAEPEPEPPPAPLDEHTEAALAKFNQAHDELAAEEHEVHHDKHDTAVLYVPPAEA